MPEKLIGSSNRVTAATEPGNAVWNDLWLAGVDGKGWTNLTNFTTSSLTGALSPYFSHDGRKLVYSTLRRAADKLHSFGYWDLHVADFTLEPKPHLTHDRILLSQEGIYESHGFSLDDTHILFSSDRGLANSLGLDLWQYDLSTGTARNLTNSPQQYDEHARYSPDDRFIVWGSSKCCDSYRTSLSTLISEAFVMHISGEGPSIQLTHFNTPGYPESSKTRSGGWPTAWSQDGRHIAIAQQLLGDLGKGRRVANPSWIISFDDSSIHSSDLPNPDR
jgi:Tol biopolymer transport system component